jgi:RimJ/RimL family protein N-acetyltransferase
MTQATIRDELARIWPQFALRIDVDGARLEAPTDAQLLRLARSAARPGAVLEPSQAHYVKWLAGNSPAEIQRGRTARVWANRNIAKRPGWTLDLAVVVGEEPIGMQCLSGFDQWPARRIVGTTSWLLAHHQGRGLGARCRAAVLELAFTHLAAETAKSWALRENHASNAVSERLGYQLLATNTLIENQRELVEHVYQLAADDWMRSPVRDRFRCAINGGDGLARLLSDKSES